MNELITKIATKHQKQMCSVHPLDIIATIEDAIKEALNNKELVKNWDKPHVSNNEVPVGDAILKCDNDCKNCEQGNNVYCTGVC